MDQDHACKLVELQSLNCATILPGTSRIFIQPARDNEGIVARFTEQSSRPEAHCFLSRMVPQLDRLSLLEGFQAPTARSNVILPIHENL